MAKTRQRMSLDHQELLFVEASRFGQDRVGDFELAEVVQQSARNDQLYFVMGVPQFGGQDASVIGHVSTMREGCVIVM